MSMELHVLCRKSRLPDVRQWQAAIAALGVDVTLDPSADVGVDSGFLPATFKGRDGGFEFDVSPAAEVVEAYPEFEAEFAGHDACANFRWGGNLDEMACALVAAAALVKVSDGVWFDPQEGACRDAAGALEQAKSAANVAG